MSKIGFIGLGTMGLPMAVNIAEAGLELMVYNRTRSKSGPVVEAGAKEADSPSALLEWADIVVMMLSGPQAVDDVLEPLIKERPGALKGKLVANMGTNQPGFSRRLCARLNNAQAVFVDAPVSGTKAVAQQGALLAMASGPDKAIHRYSLWVCFKHGTSMDAYIPNTRSNANIIASAMNMGLADEDACAIIKVFGK